MIINEDGSITEEASDNIRHQFPQWVNGKHTALNFITRCGLYDIYQVKDEENGNPRGKYCFYGRSNDGHYRTWFDTLKDAINSAKVCIT